LRRIAMAIVQQMRVQLKESMKAQDAEKTQFLRYWIAQLTKGDGTELTDEEAVKKMRGVAKEAKAGVTTFSARELELIRDWVPATLGPEQVFEALEPVAEAIRSAPKEGMAMGIAMKHLAGKPVEAEDVKAAIARVRG
jgi:uncharacterized protein YqeY